MPSFADMRLARRLQVGVLLLWLCCLGAASASPWFGAPSPVEALCSEHRGAAGDAVDGAEGGAEGGAAAPKRHGLLCPNCLPVAAPPPLLWAEITAAVAPAPPRVGALATPFIHESATRPPARAPPHRVSNQEVTP